MVPAPLFVKSDCYAHCIVLSLRGGKKVQLSHSLIISRPLFFQQIKNSGCTLLVTQNPSNGGKKRKFAIFANKVQ